MYKSISLGGLHAEHRAATKAPPVWSKGWWLLDAQHRPHQGSDVFIHAFLIYLVIGFFLYIVS